MSSLFRQVSIDRLSSPEQLDQLLRVTEPKSWLALAAIFLLLVTGVIWGFAGELDTTEIGQGIIVRSGGMLSLVSHGAGTVINVNVQVGDRVHANQVLAIVAQPSLLEKRDAMRTALVEFQRERERALAMHRNVGRLQVEAVQRQRANDERQISELQDQANFTQQQVVAEEKLLAKGLVTKEQALAVQQRLVGIRDQIAGLYAHIQELDAQKLKLETQPDQDDAEARTRIAMMQRDVAGLEKDLSLAQNVVSPYAGQVLELKVYPGGSVKDGQPIISLQPDVQDLELLAYLPASQAKHTMSGMEARISPSYVKREEFGFMKGKVIYVSDFPATAEALMRNFQNELLISSLTNAGPVTELRISLDHDPATPTGFKWSTSKGPAISITGGTLCSVEIVTRKQRPITLVLPYVKAKVGLG
ncbi:MAG TPA: NHLP bacteriocin system secretion protein [Terriglobales bacterium]|nr:NHLP bacteriocin system secretion protein [Terriglobales bacterium]